MGSQCYLPPGRGDIPAADAKNVFLHFFILVTLEIEEARASVSHSVFNVFNFLTVFHSMLLAHPVHPMCFSYLKVTNSIVNWLDW